LKDFKSASTIKIGSKVVVIDKKCDVYFGATGTVVLADKEKCFVSFLGKNNANATLCFSSNSVELYNERLKSANSFKKGDIVKIAYCPTSPPLVGLKARVCGVCGDDACEIDLIGESPVKNNEGYPQRSFAFMHYDLESVEG